MLARLGVDEHARRNARAREPPDDLAHMCKPSGHVEPTFGRELLPAFGHQHGAVGLHLGGDGHHLVGGRHLEVQSGLHGRAQGAHVGVLHVAAILAQMNGDAVGTTSLGK
jgi:hypothetical protein